MIASTIRFLLTNFPLTFFLAGLFCTLIKVYRHRINVTRSFIVESFTAYYFLWSLGISHIYNAAIHIAFPGIAANYIGWANSPFQWEAGFASLGIGLAALIGFKKDFRVRMAIVIASSVFLWACTGVHLYQLFAFHNHAQGNSGFMLWVDLLLPVISMIVLKTSYVFNKKEKTLQYIKRNEQLFFTAMALKKISMKQAQ